MLKLSRNAIPELLETHEAERWATAVFNETEIKQTVAISVILAATKCSKFVFGRGSARTPLGELTTLSRPLVCWGRGYPLPHSPSPRRLDSHAFGVRLGASLPAFRHFFFSQFNH